MEQPQIDLVLKLAADAQLAEHTCYPGVSCIFMEEVDLTPYLVKFTELLLAEFQAGNIQ